MEDSDGCELQNLPQIQRCVVHYTAEQEARCKVDPDLNFPEIQGDSALGCSPVKISPLIIKSHMKGFAHVSIPFPVPLSTPADLQEADNLCSMVHGETTVSSPVP